QLTAITRRRDALFQTSTIGGKWLSRTDTAQLNGVRTEVMIWRALETAVREPVAVYATTSSGGMYTLRVAMRQRVAGEAHNAIAARRSAGARHAGAGAAALRGPALPLDRGGARRRTEEF